ncbi:MAG TPA: exodeoxyribonuclease III [Gammaproteobacteria bacterium]|nr:exodeoxyribonuclease III [Gammaproteobacteria bacterium]
MRIISFNANGIRAAERKGFFLWLAAQDFDVCCLQELKARPEQLDERFHPPGFFTHYYCAERAGYAGVGLIARSKPDLVVPGCGFAEFDCEGRYLEARFGDLAVVSLYLPSGSAGLLRQESKDRFLALFLPYLEKLRRRRREYLLCGDWNIAHKEIDLKNWKGNRKNSGFLPHERAWLDEVFDRIGWVDAFRKVNQEPDQYTWWSQRGRAREKNVGWRIDYQIATPGLGARTRSAEIYTGENLSDHAPLILDYDWPP